MFNSIISDNYFAKLLLFHSKSIDDYKFYVLNLYSWEIVFTNYLWKRNLIVCHTDKITKAFDASFNFMEHQSFLRQNYIAFCWPICWQKTALYLWSMIPTDSMQWQTECVQDLHSLDCRYNGAYFITFQRGQYEGTDRTCLRSSVARWWRRWRFALYTVMVCRLLCFREDSTRGQTERV